MKEGMNRRRTTWRFLAIVLAGGAGGGGGGGGPPRAGPPPGRAFPLAPRPPGGAPPAGPGPGPPRLGPNVGTGRGSDEVPGPSPGTALELADPLTLARRALRAITPTTSVTVEPDARVAGRPAYALVLRPRTPSTLVGRVEVDIDAV